MTKASLSKNNRKLLGQKVKRLDITNFKSRGVDKTRPFLKFVLDIYFLPYNLLRFVRYLKMRHEYKKNEIEIAVLSKKIRDYQNWRSYGNK